MMVVISWELRRMLCFHLWLRCFSTVYILYLLLYMSISILWTFWVWCRASGWCMSLNFIFVPEGSCLIIISLQSHVRRVLPGTHVKTRWLAHLQNKLSSRYQNVFRTACSQLLWQIWNKLLSPCYKVDDGNRFSTSCRNKLLRGSCHQLANNSNLLRADDIRLVGTTCCEPVGLINLVTRW
jgi:hypothetical protein